MLEILAAIFAGMAAGFLFLLKENKELKKKEKLKDIEIEDSKLQMEASNLESSKNEIKDDISKFENQIEKNLTDSEIEKFWGKRK